MNLNDFSKSSIYIIIGFISSLLGIIGFFKWSNTYSNDNNITGNNNTIINGDNNTITNQNITQNIGNNYLSNNDIKIIGNDSDFEDKLKEIKEKYNLRNLLPLEAGRGVDKTPTNTYFWLDGGNLFIYNDLGYYKAKNIKISEYDFQILYINEEIYILGFTSESIASNMNSIKELTITPDINKDLGFNISILIPLKIIKSKSIRYTSTEKTSYLKIYDINLK